MSTQMRGLVENLLELARIDSGKLRENRECLSLSELLSGEAMLFDPVFFENGMPFAYEIAPDIIARGIVNAHGGSIHAESRDGFNTFSVQLPTLHHETYP